ncbi:AAA family ATPase [Mesorhizobium microcysteis]|uniref:AAA family ATPase n=1 Tax=Neoaquamicrobium microcysteis TaxID=2682781 RepID=A0A5D4H1Y4_9HYPH|nr:AAA family ATPase [Mesorhizobium microcysteis]TYR33525.1 AAA family ATPase [Mesorhizobium microcysteis]
MRLRQLDLTRYGKFTDYSIDFGEHVAGTPDLHIIYGLNEAGKSTALSGYLDLLFGIEERTRYGFLHQGKAMEIGACLEFDGQAHEFKRVKQRSNSLLDAHGQPVNEAILSVPLAGLTRDAYRMMFSLDDQTLEDGGNAILESKGDLGELLFSASAGLAGISSILETAITEADGIFRKRASSTKIAGLKRQIAELKSQRDDIDVQASAYRTLMTALEQAEAAYDAAMKEIGTAKARHDEIARVLRAHPLVAEYRQGDEQLSEYADLPHPPAEWASALPDLIVEETRLQTQLAGIGQREQKAREELEGLVVENRLLEMADRLDQLTDAAARYATAQEDLPKRTQALSGSSRKVDLILATLGQADIDDPKSLLIPAATIGTLRDLISEKSGVDVARQSAEKEHEAARLALEKEQRARQALDGQGTQIDAGKVAQLQSVLRRLRDGNLVAELRLAERGVPAKRQDFEDAVGGLHPWSGDGDELRRMSPPAADRVEFWKRASSDIEKRRSQIIERQRELSTKQEEDAARLAALREAIDIMDDDEAKAALLEREEAWAQHLSVLDRETADRFETRMRATDAAAAARLNRARELEELRSLAAGLAATTASVDRQRQLLRETDEELQTLRREIRTETPAEIDLGDDASVGSWLTRIGRWAETRTSALTAWDDLRRASSDAEEARTALATEQDSLAMTLINVGIVIDGLDVAALMLAADTILSDHAAMHTKRQDAHNRIGDLEAAAVRRKAELDDAVTAAENWQTDWSTALVSTWFNGEGSVGAVRELLDAIASLPEVLREQDDLRHRIDSMEADRKSFVEAVAQLHDALGDTFDDSNPVDAAKILLRRHEEARQVEAKRQERDQSLIDLAIERERLDGEIAVHAARTKEPTDFFQTETLADVRQALERCRKRDELVEQQGKLERQIVGDMQLPSLETAMANLADADVAELQREQAELVTRLEDLDGRAKNLFADKARATDRLTAIGGDDAAARLEANRRTLLLEIEDLALRYLRLRSGSLVAEHGIRAYRDKHRSAMMNRASEAFRLITRDEYTGLATRPDKDREALIGLSRHGGSKLAVEMSKGTQFQLYLALRLAGYEEFAAARPSVPFIADDIMETFDEPRSEEVFRLFAQMAQVGQVIYFTHHRHLCEIASQVLPQTGMHEIA